MRIALLTGGADRPYAFGLATALMARGIQLDLIAGDDLSTPQFTDSPDVNFLNLRGNQHTSVGILTKVARVLAYYVRLLRYARMAKPQVFHILWNNKFEWFDRTLLMLYYKSLRKKIVLTVHNVNAGWRDGTDSLLNHVTLKAQYRLAHRIFVHTEKMKAELRAVYGVHESKVSVIPFGINNAVPQTDLTTMEARRRLGVSPDEKILLFFGSIAPYKGLEYLVDAFERVAASPDYRLVIAGSPKKGFEEYWTRIETAIRGSKCSAQILQRITFIPDDETEVYFKAADVLILPYTEIFQSGVLFLGYSFGLPVIASDVGSLKDDIAEGRTGFVVPPNDAAELARAIESYFGSQLFHDLNDRRSDILAYALERHSWTIVGSLTEDVYAGLLRGSVPQDNGSQVLT
jgi:glycosyltransferase involved in cell wall biosynthesis